MKDSYKLIEILLSLTVFLCLSLSAYAAGGGKITFSHLSTNEGLSQSTVLSIAQDKKGFMWFATLDGLNRYDGYEFTSYKNNPDDTTTIADNMIRDVFIDSGNNLWAGTGKGLSLWNREKEIFRNYQTPDRAQVKAIEEISDSLLIVGAGDRLCSFDIPSGKFIYDFPERISRLDVNSMHRSGGTIYIGCNSEGLFEYSIKGNEFRRISLMPGSRQINCILPQGPDTLWVGTEGDGLFLLDLKNSARKNYRHGTGTVKSNYIRSLSFDTEGRLWIGTFNNLTVYDTGNDSFTHFSSDPFIPESLSQNSIRSIYRDDQGGIWLGTYFGGVNYWHPLRERFTKIQQRPDGNSLNDNIISCIIEDGEGIMWIGTNKGGVNRYDPASNTFSHYDLHNRSVEEIESNDIKAIYADPANGMVYIGAHAGGLNILDRKSGRIEHYRSTEEQLPQDIYSIIPADDGRLWIGSLQGLYVFSKNTGLISPVETDLNGDRIPKIQIRALFRDSKHRLWIGGENGMSVYGTSGTGLIPEDGYRSTLDTLSFVLGFIESSSGQIWINSRKGLYCFNPGNGELHHYTAADGLPNNIVHGIEEDSSGRLWLSTDNGLSCFNPYSGTFRNFTAADGLQGNQFSTYSHCRRQNGEMYFGGLNGITVFTPELMEDNPYAPQPVISELQLFNSTVLPDDNTGILSESISETDKITLRHNQNSITVKFTVIDHIAGGHNTFAYMLDGMDKDWNITNTVRSVSYSNLPHGKYQFLVKAANNDGKWCETPASLTIHILPVWYRTIWAKLLFFLIAAILATGIIKFLIYRKTLESRLELEKKDKEHQEEINQMKMRFFINISHELRTPLTLIITPLQEIIDRASDVWIRKQLKYVYRNAQRMLHLVNQLMDYRRAELGVFKLRVKHENVHRIVKENFSYYEKLAQSKKLKYTLISEIEDKLLYVDEQYIELILNNLLSNAFKYTDHGSITVKAACTGNDFVLEVSDTGAGIPDDQQGHIFERFYQLESQHIGSGIGLSLVQRLVELHHATLELESQENKGSTFRVRFPQDLSAYSAEELGTDEGKEPHHTTNAREMYVIDTEKQQDEILVDDKAKKGRILIVEDNEEIRTYMNNGLSSVFSTLLASNGEEAVKLVKSNEIDLIVTDVMMPVMGGIKLCSVLKHDINTSHIPVIMLSAKADSRNELEALQTGADDYIPKPFSMAVLTAKIQNMLRARSRMLEKYSKSMDIEPEKITFNVMDEDLIRKAIEIVEQNMDNAAFTTDDFAKAMNMSRSNLHLKLKAITGESALDFIHKIRFKKACELLKEGRYTISEISDKVGFNTPSYFTTCFKKYLGCLPTEYVNRT